jgi:hypothetical protein
MKIDDIGESVRQILLKLSKDEFLYDLLLAYGKPKASIKRLQQVGTGSYNLSKQQGTVLWKKQVHFTATTKKDLAAIIDDANEADAVEKYTPRFVIVTNFDRFVAMDTKTGDSLDIPFVELHQHIDFFLPWAGMEKAQGVVDNPADVKAAEKMAKLYDLIRADNRGKDAASIHALNVFLSRLLFCFFAEDTQIFPKDLFSNSIASHTSADGSDIQEYLQKLFRLLNVEDRKKCPGYLRDFPYVNGGLFAEDHTVPKFSAKSRAILIECGADLNWSEINPDIFGSMIQAVVDVDQREDMGMHYTSVANIMKVIEPLFLDALQEEFQSSRGNAKRLEGLLKRISAIRIFDPACGSGNFLIIAYKELRKLEMDVLNALSDVRKQNDFGLSGIRLSHFFGIELDDFAHEVAILSMWLAEHQMNQAFMVKFGKATPALPLKASGHIYCDNATRTDWERVCPPDETKETYILGNPPYHGSRRQNDEQTEDLKHVFGKDYMSIDYIFAWFYKGAKYVERTGASLAFVSTNSICQGEQVALSWPKILSNSLEIGFSHTSFRWHNNAKANAAVTVVVVGLRQKSDANRYIYRDGYKVEAKEINPYLADAKTVYVHSRSKAFEGYPEMNFGNMPADGGMLLFTPEERDAFVVAEPTSERWFMKCLSAREFLSGRDRWCLWLVGITKPEIASMPLVAKRVAQLKKIRLNSSRPQLADIPHLFAQITQPPDKSFILIPRHSSENRAYIPMGFFDKTYIASDSCLIVPTQDLVLFGLLTSRMHMTWVRTVAGRIKTDFRYSKDIVYNTFPFPRVAADLAERVKVSVRNLLAVREEHSEFTLSQLYDPKKMPEDLKKAHDELDVLIDRTFRVKPFDTDNERLSYLFEQYLAKTRKTNNA